MTGFIYYFAALGAILSASTILPVLVAFGLGEVETGYRMLLYGFLGAFFCIAVLLSIAGKPIGLERRAAALLVVTCWVCFPLVVAIPLSDVTELTFAQALFQSMASFTTTGSMVFINPEAVPRSVIFLLAQFQWLGGIATLTTFILILSPWEIGGLPKIGSASETASIVASEYRLVRFCGRILRAMTALTLICFACLIIVGMPVYEAMVLSFSALSTGGIVPATESLDLLLGNAGMIILGIAFIVACTSIFWHRSLANLRFEELFAHRESYFILGVWVFFAVVIAYRVIVVSGGGGAELALSAVSEGIMNAASLISTSGIQSRPGVFTVLAPTLVILLTLIGSGCFSTSGGIKFFRLGVVFKHAEFELNRLIYPNSVQTTRFASGHLNLSFMKGIWGFFSLWILALGFGGLFLTLSGLDFQAGFTAAAAALSNAGPVYGSFWAPEASVGWVAYSDMSPFQLGLLTVMMLFGRLEIVVVIASVALAFQARR